jgi:hypothetical protein
MVLSCLGTDDFLAVARNHDGHNTRRQQANRRGGLWIGLDPLALLRAAEMWLMRGTGFQPVLGAQDTG